MGDPQSGAYPGKLWLDQVGPYDALLIIEREMIDVSTNLPQRNPMWTHVDQAGHWHAYDRDGELPTLERREVHRECDGRCAEEYTSRGLPEPDDCEGYTVAVYRCLICDEEIEPGTIPGPHFRMMPGRYDWRVTAELRDETLPVAVLTAERLSVRHIGWDDVTRFGVGLRPQMPKIEGGYDDHFKATIEIHGVSPLGVRSIPDRVPA